MITNERMELFAAYLKEHQDRVPDLLDLEPAEVQAIVNADGHDFTIEEITSIGEAAQVVLQKVPEGELTEEALKDVAGGCLVPILVGTLFVSGVGICAFGLHQTTKTINKIEEKIKKKIRW